jgi:hypothetical protein
MRRGLFLLFLLCALVSLVSPFSAGAGLNTQESALLQEMNRVRVAHGVPALQNDTHLQRAATSHSREMLESNTFSHGAFGSRMLQFDVSFNTAGENLAWGTGSNLLRPSFRRVGIGEVAGTFQGHGGAHVVTADFAG